METHIFIPSKKKDVFYCKLCQKLSYKEIISQSNFKYDIKLNMDPLTLKFVSFSSVANYNLANHIKYLEHKRIGISFINSLINLYGLKSMILYKAISLMDQIYLENEVSIDNIETISIICIFLALQFNECCLPYNNENNFTKEENDIFFHSFLGNNKLKRNKSNINGFFHYVKKKVRNFRYWEVLCLKYLNYDLRKSSAYDYLLLFFKLGIFFCKEKIDVMNRLTNCLNILDYVINDIKSCNYSQYTLAMSIIKVAFEFDKFFDKNIFKMIYGVDLSKKKYNDCSKMIENILSMIINNKYNNLKDNVINCTKLYNFIYFSNVKYFNNNNKLLFYLCEDDKNLVEKKINNIINYVNIIKKFFIDSNVKNGDNKKFEQLNHLSKGIVNNKIIHHTNNMINNQNILNNYNICFQNSFNGFIANSFM